MKPQAHKQAKRNEPKQAPSKKAKGTATPAVATSEGTTCSDGVCKVTWKPRRSAA